MLDLQLLAPHSAWLGTLLSTLTPEQSALLLNVVT